MFTSEKIRLDPTEITLYSSKLHGTEIKDQDTNHPDLNEKEKNRELFTLDTGFHVTNCQENMSKVKRIQIRLFLC